MSSLYVQSCLHDTIFKTRTWRSYYSLLSIFLNHIQPPFAWCRYTTPGMRVDTVALMAKSYRIALKSGMTIVRAGLQARVGLMFLSRIPKAATSGSACGSSPAQDLLSRVLALSSLRGSCPAITCPTRLSTFRLWFLEITVNDVGELQRPAWGTTVAESPVSVLHRAKWLAPLSRQTKLCP